MALKRNNEEYTEEETQRRFQATLRAALNTPPKPLKSISPKHPKKKKSKTPKKHV